MNLNEKIYNVMCDTEALEKDLTVGKGETSYKAVGEKVVLNMLKPLFKKYKLIIYPFEGEISETNSTWDVDYGGKKETKVRNVTQVKLHYKLVDVESGESIVIVGLGNGADSQDKGSGKALTYAYKTALSKTFMLFSGEDTDTDHSDDIGNTDDKTKHNPPPIPDGTEYEPPIDDGIIVCDDCGNEITPTSKSSVDTLIAKSQKYYKKNLCSKCSYKRYEKDHPNA
jgi:hypothetical protein